MLVANTKIYKQDLYFDFIEDNPDFAPKAKMTISRTRFYQWLTSYCLYKEGVSPEEGRDSQGRWMRIRHKYELEENGILDLLAQNFLLLNRKIELMLKKV